MSNYCLLFVLGLLGLSACQDPVEGCMHPRALNFNPEADVDIGCVYFPVQLQWQHYTRALPDNTLNPGDVLYDDHAEAFLVDRFYLLGSEVYLQRVGASDPTRSASTFVFATANGGLVEEEDNFFVATPESPVSDAGGWIELGDFDRVTFQLGVDERFQNPDPGDIDPRPSGAPHPLSASATPYLYDSTQTAYPTLQLTVVQPDNGGRSIDLQLYERFAFDFEYNVTAVDNEVVPVPLRLDYDLLFRGIHWTEDPDTVVKTKLLENLPRSIYLSR